MEKKKKKSLWETKRSQFGCTWVLEFCWFFASLLSFVIFINNLTAVAFLLFNQSPPEVHANVAETLCTITRVASSTLAIKLSSPRFCVARLYFIFNKYMPVNWLLKLLLCSFVAKILGYALEDSQSKSSLVNSLSVCISLLDPKKSAISSPLFHSFRSQNMYEPPIPVNPDTIGAMLPKLSKSKFMCF